MTDFNEMTSPPPAPEGEPSTDEKTWGMLAHLSALSGLVTGGVGCIVGPLVVWLIKKDTMPFVADQAKEALNFNLTLLLVAIVLGVLTVGSFFLLTPLTALAGMALGAAWLVLTIIALVKANEGTAYRYPFAIRLVK